MGHIEIVDHVISDNGVTEIVIPWDEIPESVKMDIELDIMVTPPREIIRRSRLAFRD
jgi:hypothetical protein